MRLSRLSVPLHAESIPLGRGPRRAAVAVGTTAIGAGLGVLSAWRGTISELVCATLVSAGAIVLWLSVRGGRCDVTIGTTRIDVRAGPFGRTAPVAAVVRVDRRAASAWRRWYAAEEVVVRTSTSPGEIVLPTRRPREVVVTLQRDSQDPGD